jgi:hypothetical protein
MLAHIPDKVADLHLKVAREFYQNSLEALSRRVEVQTIKLTLDHESCFDLKWTGPRSHRNHLAFSTSSCANA